MANMYINAMTALWNSVGTVYSAIKMNVSDSGSASTSKLLDMQVSSVERFTVKKNGDVMTTGLIAAAGAISGAGFLPPSSDGGAIGSSALPVSDLFIASGGVINWAAADVTITHSSNALAFAGASSGYSFDAPIMLPASGSINFNSGDVTVTHAVNALAFAGAGNGYSFDQQIKPATDDGAPLGSTSFRWSDLFMALGAVINIAGDWIATHTAGILTVGTGDLRVTNAGTNAESVVTVGGTQTLTSKSLTSPALTGTPTSPTASVGTNTTQVATTAFVQTETLTGGYAAPASITDSDYMAGWDDATGYAKARWTWSNIKTTARAYILATSNSFSALQAVRLSSAKGVADGGGSDFLEVNSTGGGGAAMMTFHRSGAHAMNFGLHTDNVLRMGGWSMGAVAHAIIHEGNVSYYVNAYVPGACSVMAADSLGSYMFGRHTAAGPIGAGGGIAGASITATSLDGSGDPTSTGGALSGAWRLMGHINASGGRAALWLRYA